MNTPFETVNQYQEGKIWDKVEAAKSCFDDISQSGRNNYQKFNYFELKDINPRVRAAAKKFGFKTKFELGETVGTLIIEDKEDKSRMYYTIPLPTVTDEDVGKYMQNIGRIRTYAMRYLYIQAFEIAVPDEIDNVDQNKRKKLVKKDIKKPVKQPPKQQMKKPIRGTPKPVNPQQKVINQIKSEIEEKTGKHNPKIDDIKDYIYEHTSEDMDATTHQLYMDVLAIIGG